MNKMPFEKIQKNFPKKAKVFGSSADIYNRSEGKRKSPEGKMPGTVAQSLESADGLNRDRNGTRQTGKINNLIRRILLW